jgi:hypothetical protein
MVKSRQTRRAAGAGGESIASYQVPGIIALPVVLGSQVT